jgi:hypothetical protein
VLTGINSFQNELREAHCFDGKAKNVGSPEVSSELATAGPTFTSRQMAAGS